MKTKTKTKNITDEGSLEVPPSHEITEETTSLLEEQLTRNISFLGREGFEKYQQAFIVVLGLGGVGSHAAHMMVRSGVRKIRLVDPKRISESSLVSNAFATLDDIDRWKVQVAQQHLYGVTPHVVFECFPQAFCKDIADQLLKG
jgi:tRNA A37 threonylcarbamoyladenosine dehydratase